MKKLLVAILLLIAFPAFAQKPPINGVAGPTTSAQLRSIITDPSGSGFVLFGASNDITINGTACTVGSSCTVSASATSVTVGTTTISSGASNGVLYDNSGVLGNLATSANGVLVTSPTGVPSISTTLPNGLAMGTPASLSLANATGLPATGFTIGSGSTPTSGFTNGHVVGVSGGTTTDFGVSGTGTTVALTTSPVLTTPTLGAASGTSLSLSGLTGLTGALHTTQSASGTSASAIALNTFTVNLDTAIQNTGGFVTAWQFDHHFGGSSVQGGREALAAYLYLDATTSGSNANRNYAAVNGIATANVSDGGTNPAASGTSAGAIFGGGFVGVAASGATALLNVTGTEFNVAMQTGSSVWAKSLAQFSARSDDRVAGSGINAMLWLYNQSASNPAWSDGILFDNDGGSGSFPLNNTSTVLRTGAGTINNGIDFSGTTVSGSAFKSPAFSVSGAGALVALNGSFNNGGFQIINGATSDLELGGTSQTPVFDWHSSASSNDYDVRLQASGGNASSGNGTLTLVGANFTLSGATLTYGGTTFANTATGTGSLVGSISPTFTGTVGAAAINASGIVTAAGFTATAPVVLPGYAVASLPASPGAGALAYVTDQLTACPALSSTFTGGGSVKCRAWYNGTAWVQD